MAIKFEAELKDVDGILKKFPKSGKIISRFMTSAMRKSLDHTEEQVVGFTPVFMGALSSGITTETIGVPLRGNFIGKVIAGGAGEIYGLPVEVGRAAGKMPPVDAIEFWVRRKGIDTSDTSRSTAFVIARSIGAKGTKGVFMFKKGFEAALPTLKRIWDKLPDQITRAIGGS